MSGSLSADPLFKGLTRPAMIFGVSYSFAMLNMMFNMIYFVNAPSLSHKLLAIFLIATLHGIGYIACSKEPLFIELYRVKVSKCTFAWKNYNFHGANSYDVFL